MNQPKTTTHHQRLPEIEIDEDAKKKYLDMFASTRVPNKYIKKSKEGWREIKRKWSGDPIESHLRQTDTLGLFPAEWINYLMIDLDNHGGATEDLHKRATLCINAIGGVPIIYRSSDSGGIRLFYPLDQEYPRDSVLSFAAQRILAAGGTLAAGNIEVMAGLKGDRLPFGHGSCLLDSKTFSPRDLSLADTIETAWQTWSKSKLEIPREHLKSQPVAVKSNQKLLLAQSLLKEGLKPDMSTNDSLLLLARHLMRDLGYTKEQATQEMKEWAELKHNGHSQRINAGNLDSVKSQIERIIEGYDPDRQGKKTWLNLTLDDIRTISSECSSYRDRLAYYSILLYCKNKGTIQLGEDLDHLGTSNSTLNGFTSLPTTSKLPPKGTLKGNYNVTPHQQVWLCEIPFTAFKGFPGFDSSRPTAMRLKLEDMGLLSTLKPEDRKNHKCRTYRIEFNFSSDSRPVASLDEGLKLLREKGENSGSVANFNQVVSCSFEARAQEGGRE
jgi:hypothetical protein